MLSTRQPSSGYGSPGFDFHPLRGFNSARFTVHVNGPWRITFELEEESGVAAEMAIRIGKLCGNGPDLWIRMQEAHDLWRAKQKIGREIETIPTLKPAA